MDDQPKARTHTLFERKEPRGASSLDLGRFELRPAFLGFSLVIAHQLISSFTSLSFDGEADPNSIANLVVHASTFSNLLVLLFIAAFSSRLAPYCNRRRVTSVISILAFALTVALGLLSRYASPSFFGVAYGVVIAACRGWLFVVWGELFCCLNTKHIVFYVISAFIVSIAVYFLLLPFSGFVRFICMGALLPLSGLAANLCATTYSLAPATRNSSSTRRDYLARSWRICLVFFAFWTLYSLTNIQSNQTATLSIEDRYCTGLGVAILLTVIIAFVYTRVSEVFSSLFVYRIVLPLAVIGYALAAVGGVGEGPGIWVTVAAHTSLNMYYYVMVFETTRQTSCLPAWSVSLSLCALPLGGIAAFIANYMLFPLFDINPGNSLIFVLAICVLVLSVSLFLFSGTQAPDDASTQDPPPGTIEDPETIMRLFAQRYNVAVKKFGLSDREAQVLLYTIQGRSASYIAKELMLAQSTVKTHTRHIYQKMDVGDRQEMLDLIESLDV